MNGEQAFILAHGAAGAKIGNLDDLDTQSKGNLVEAINEAYNTGGGGSQVFWATYGTTTYSSVSAAYAAGKTVLLKSGANGNVGYLTCISDTDGNARFTCVINNEMLDMTLTQTNVWSNSRRFAEQTANKVTAISSASTDAQYPSAKAVHDALDSKTDVFWAEYKETTFAEVAAAHAAGKIVLFEYAGYIARLAKITSTQADFIMSFATNLEAAINTLTLSSDDEWTTRQIYVQNTDDKVSSVTSASTHSEYPTAKAVYDYVNSTITNAIGGAY